VSKKTKLSKSSLHWFIRSRPYVLLAELRRRFDLDGSDEVRAIQTPAGRTYVGLPERAARLIEDLVRENRVGLECIADVHARLAIGLYAFDLLKTPIGLQRSNPFARPPGAGQANGAVTGEGPGAEAEHEGSEDDDPETDARGDVTTVASSPLRERPPERPRFDRGSGGRGDRRQGDRRQGERRDIGRVRADEAPAQGAPERRGGGRPDVPRRDRTGRPDLPQPRSERSGPGSQGRRGEGRRGPDRPGTRSGKPS
jgi:hypothetical protein